MITPTIRMWPTEDGAPLYLKPHGPIEPQAGLIVWLESGPSPGYYQILEGVLTASSLLRNASATELFGGPGALLQGGKYVGFGFEHFHLLLDLTEHEIKLFPKDDAIMRVVGEFHLQSTSRKGSYP